MTEELVWRIASVMNIITIVLLSVALVGALVLLWRRK